MKGDKLPDQDHVVRFCQPTRIADEQIQATAFMVREGEESLSVNWLEFFELPSREGSISALRKTYYSKFNRIGAGAKLAVLNISEVCDKVLKESRDRRKLEILHDPEVTPEYEDLSHSGIYHLRHDDELIAELILETVREIYPARGNH